MSDQQQEVRDALARLERTAEVGFARLAGRMDVVIERLDQQARRADEHAEQIATLDQRLDAVERDAATRAEVQQVRDTAVTHEELERRQAASHRVIGIIMGVLTLVTGVGTPLLTIALT